MIQNFETYAQELRKLGNSRCPYTICVVLANGSALHDQTLDRIGATYIYAREQSDYSEVVKQILDCQSPACVVFNEQTAPEPQYLCFFNEVHKADASPLPGFKCKAMQDHERLCFMRQYIDDPNIIALKCDAKFAGQFEDFKPWQPWYTLFVHQATKEACQVIWDTREIIGYAKLTDDQLNTALTFPNVNDNGLLLYKRTEMPEDNGYKAFIIDTIES